MTNLRKKIIDDSHLRWKQPGYAQQVWENYDKKIIPQMVFSLLQKKSCSFRNFYQKLAIARARCEFEKKPDEDKFSIISKVGFGTFSPSGVPEVNSIERWGVLATQFVKGRVATTESRKRGLSQYRCYGRIDHPGSENDLEYVLEKIDPFFQELIRTTHFFRFLQLSARMIYDLSNYPPIVRGSAAVNTWPIEWITKINFNIPISLRPLLYDWVAFFETPEQYASYYIISSTANYLKTIPYLNKKYKTFFEKLTTELLKNPNVVENLQRRKVIWETLKNYASDALKKTKLNSERDILQTIATGNIIFRTPSNAMLAFVKAIKAKESTSFDDTVANIKFHKSILTRDMLIQIVNEAGFDLNEFKKILNLHFHTSNAYLLAYANPLEEEKLNQYWPDLELLRTLEYGFDDYASTLRKILFPEGIEPIKEISAESGFGVITISFNPTTIPPEALKKIVNNKPSYALYRDQSTIYFIELDGKATLINLKDSSFFPKSSEELYQIFAKKFPEKENALESLSGFLFKIVYYDCESIRFRPIVNTLRLCSLATWDNIAELSLETLNLITADHPKDNPLNELKAQLLDAIWSGGITLQDLIGLNLCQLHTITAPEALALYKKNQLIFPQDILSTGSYAVLETKISTDEEKTSPVKASETSTKVKFDDFLRNLFFKQPSEYQKPTSVKRIKQSLSTLRSRGS